MQDFWHLHRLDWLAELSAAESDRLRRESVQHVCRPAEMIFAPKANPSSVYLLERGLVRIYRASPSGDETTFGYVLPGEVFGELAALSNRPRESYAQAVRSSTVWQIPRDSMRRVFAAHAGIVLAVSKQLGNRLKRIESRVEHLVFYDVRVRLARILLDLADDFGRQDREVVRIELDLRQDDLATLVGATRQAVNIALRDLEERGLIRRARPHLLILRRGDLAALGEVSISRSAKLGSRRGARVVRRTR